MQIDVGPDFIVRFICTCPWCERSITPGDTAAYVDGAVSCSECVEAAREANEYEEYFGDSGGLNDR